LSFRKPGFLFELLDNAFVAISDLAQANQLATALDAAVWPCKLDELAGHYCRWSKPWA
jgi:hypothetical protein